MRPSVVGRVVDAKSRNSSVSSVSLCPLCRTQRPTARDDVMQERSRRVCLNTEDTENTMNNLEDNDTLTQRISPFVLSTPSERLANSAAPLAHRRIATIYATGLNVHPE